MKRVAGVGGHVGLAEKPRQRGAVSEAHHERVSTGVGHRGEAVRKRRQPPRRREPHEADDGCRRSYRRGCEELDDGAR